MSRLSLLLALPTALTVLAACGAGGLASDDVATKAEDALEKQVGSRPDITCPDDLEATVGATTRCVLTAGDDPTEYGVQITVTSVDGDDATFDVAVDEQPQG
ncbi:MAG: hypothetical protein JWQ99_3435 [Blastococcus sp.]|nr:hypothetical protein [Blastococcus sp.]